MIRASHHFLSLLGVATCITQLLCVVDLSAALHHTLVVPCPPYLSNTKFQFSRGIPEGCVQSECDYFVGINPNTMNENLLEFTLEGNARGWLAVGFSKTPSMYSADVLGCSRHSSGLVTIIDTWNSNHFKYNVMKEKQDDICHYSAGYDYGRMKCTFSRTTKGSNFKYDLDLTDDYYLLFGVGQTQRDSFTQGFTYHSLITPVISEKMINPITGAIHAVNVTTAASRRDHSHTTAPSAYTTVATTVTAAAVDEASQDDSTTEPQKTNACPSSLTPHPYRLTHRIPSGCDPSQCDYFLGISTNANDDNLLDFTLESSAQGWVAVGFSKTPDMLEADVVGCNVHRDGRVVAIDTWNPLLTKWNVLDDDQSDICHYSAEIKDGGRLRCRFSRSIRGSSREQDLDLDDDYYLLFGSRHNSQMLGNGGFTYHNRVPPISSVMINPVQDSDLSVELSLVASNLNLCPSIVSNSSTYRISQGFPRGCQQSECDYFVGINTNPEDDQFLDFTLEGNAEGWVAVGFSDSPSMANSDVLGCIKYENGMTWVIDTWNPASQRTNILDETQTDICLHYIEYINGRLQCTFSRSVLGATPDTDINLNGEYYLLFGVGNRLQNTTVSGGFTYHDKIPHISPEVINPVNSSNDEAAITQEFSETIVRALTKTHGILMIIAWPILVGTAIYFSAYMKPVLSKNGEWFYVHGGLMLTSIVFTSVSLALIFIAHIGRRVSGLVDFSVTLSLTHFVIGIFVAASQIFNMLVSLFRCQPSSRFRWIYSILHGKLIGYITALLSLANIAVGIYLFDSGHNPAFGLFLVVAILGVLMYEILHLLYNVLPRLLKFCHKKGEQEQSLLSINEKYADSNDESKSPLGELKAVLAYSYRHHFGTLVLVLTVIVPINIVVCIYIAIA